MLVLGIFRDRTFSASNVMTLLVYGALGAMSFFVTHRAPDRQRVRRARGRRGVRADDGDDADARRPRRPARVSASARGSR